jgi:hypothetical protein
MLLSQEGKATQSNQGKLTNFADNFLIPALNVSMTKRAEREK